MSKADQLAKAFTQKTKESKPFEESFERNTANSAFAGMFGNPKLTEKEHQEIQLILNEYFQPGLIKEENVSEDLKTLLAITGEIKAISSQSILLHGERIKKVQDLLRDYREGAFTKWLLFTYGNRQTPYSMLQYYEFYQSLSSELRKQIERMPKKAAYTLAARDGSLDRKLEILKNYSGERQDDVISLIQETFPGDSKDRRRKLVNSVTIQEIAKLCGKIEKRKSALTNEDKECLHALSEKLSNLSK